MFEKYKLYDNMPGFGISKRFLLFFRRKMTHTKIVKYENSGSASSKELLIFDNMNIALSELDWLKSTGMEAKTKVWENGVLMEIRRKKG